MGSTAYEMHSTRELLNNVIKHLEIQDKSTASLLALVSAIAVALFCLSPSKPIAGPSKSLQALLTVIVPPGLAWPSDYATLLDHSACIRSRTIRIQLSVLLLNIKAGTVEFRDSDDLPNLFLRRLRVYGWLIHLDVDLSLWASVLWWILVSQVPSFKVRSGPCFTNKSSYPAREHSSNENEARAPHKRIAFGGGPEEISPEIYHLPLRYMSKENPPLVAHLDFVPYPHLEWSIRAVQSGLDPGTSASFEFTTVALSVPLLGDQFILCSLPFMPRQYSLKDNPPQRTSTPLLAPLHRITELLSSGPSATVITSIDNVTAARIAVLQNLEHKLVLDRTLRSVFIDKWGAEGWREHRLMIAWEAGLLSAGYLARWIVVIRK